MVPRKLNTDEWHRAMGMRRKRISVGFLRTCIYDHAQRVRVCSLLSQELSFSWSLPVMSQHSAELFRIDFPSSFNAI